MADADDHGEERSEEEEMEKSAGGLVTGGVIGAGMGGGGLPSTFGGAISGQIVAEEVMDEQTDVDRGEGPANLRDTPGTFAGAGQTRPVDKPLDRILAEAEGDTEER